MSNAIKKKNTSPVSQIKDLKKNTDIAKSAKPVAKSAKPVVKSVKPVAKSAKPVAKSAKSTMKAPSAMNKKNVSNVPLVTQISTNETFWIPEEPGLTELLNAHHPDPHSILGLHEVWGHGMVIRVMDPQATRVCIVWEGGKAELKKVNSVGLWVLGFPDHHQHFAYHLEKYYGETAFIAEDPYCFLPQIGEMDLHLFNEGTHEKVYDFMGAHRHSAGSVSGILFCVWAPNAQRVSVVGNFNCWDGRRHVMRRMGMSGIWELFIPRLAEGEIYKYEICTREGNVILKLDPYAYRVERRPNNASVIDNSAWDFHWNDQNWIEKRAQQNWLEQPVSIYEVHLGSWQGPGLRPINSSDENDFHNYREIADALAAYVKEMGYTHIELMPVLEHPLDISWGYQVSAYYAPTSRYGSPEDFAYFVNHMHENGIGVLLDWVPAHFPKDAWALGRFDGTALYEHQDPRQGEHQDWGTYIFNFGRCEVRSFLLGNALYWLDKFHLDGLRVDAVASMLYLDYSRKAGEWIPNKYGGRENIDAIDFLRNLNILTNQLFPGSVMIAEESTAWPGVSKPTYTGGLGFNLKWNMGWMHDVLHYFQKDPIHRCYHQNDLTFSLIYYTTENFILPLSHDEVVHGKHSLLDKMPGDYWRKFANLRALYAWMMTHPGKKLLFMGGEFGQWIEWNCLKGLDWCLLDYENHQKLHCLSAKLNKIYLKYPALWEDDFTSNGFQWIDASNYQESVLAYLRWDKKRQSPVLVVLNLTPTPHTGYHVGVPMEGQWIEILNTDHTEWGGSGVINEIPLKTTEHAILFHGQHYSIPLSLPPLGATILVPEKTLKQ